MVKLDLQGCIVGNLATNCFLLKNKETNELIVVDPGGSAERILKKIYKIQGKPVAIFLTHGHFDHIMAVKEIKEEFDIPVYAYHAEEQLLKDPELNLSEWGNGSYTAPADIYLNDLQMIELAGFKIQVIHTPGHTKGSCCYYFTEEDVLVSGDTLFYCSAGRTDFPGGSASEMQNSLERLLTSLPGETKVLPGHGQMTTIDYEKRYNPFV